jgi:hypothetical protein
MMPKEVLTGLVMGARKTNASIFLMVMGDSKTLPFIRKSIYWGLEGIASYKPIIKKKAHEDQFMGLMLPRLI